MKLGLALLFTIVIIGRVVSELRLAVAEDPVDLQRSWIHHPKNVIAYRLSSLLMAGSWLSLIVFLWAY